MSGPGRPAASRPSRAGPALLALGALAATLTLTFQAWRNARAAEAAERRADFDLRVAEVEASVVRRMAAAEQVLRGAAGLFAASERVERAEFRDYLAALDLARANPGIQGVGFGRRVAAGQERALEAEVRRDGLPAFRVWPEAGGPERGPVVFCEPEVGRNLQALGYDMLSEPVRGAAMARAADLGAAALTARLTLVVEGTEDVQPGAILYLPVYRPRAPLRTVEERRAALEGWLYAAFRMRDLMTGSVAGLTGSLDLSLYDGFAPARQALTYASRPAPEPPGAASADLTTTRRLEIAGRPWTLVLVDRAGAGAPRSSRSTLLAAAGVLGGLALALLVWLLGAGRARALEAAGRAGQDATERRAAAEEIEAARRFAQATLDAMPDEICVLDEAGVVLSVNRAWREFGAANGAPPDGLGPGTRYLDASERAAAAGDEGAARFAAGLHAVLEGRQAVLVHDYEGHSPGAPRWFVARATRFTDGARVRVVLAHQEVTERVQAEAALRESQAELVAATRLAEVGTLAAGVAHEINNPLTWLHANLGLALDRLAPGCAADPAARDELRQLLAEAQEGSERIAGIVKAMRALGRPERAEPARPVDVRAELLQAVQLVRNQLEQRAALELDLPEALPAVLARAGELGRAFLNLLVNASQAVAEGGGRAARITARARAAPGEVVVEVHDTGPGIPPAVRERIFVPFFTTKPVGQGTGLGLPIARSIVEAAGGRIEVESEPGRGATFRVRLPALAAAEAPAPAPAAGPVTAATRRRVLVVDDEPAVARALARWLGRAHEVTVLGAPGEALRRLDAGERWDALLVDLMMPGIDGPAFHEALAARHPALLARLAFITGGAFGDRATGFLARHPVPVLPKPFDLPSLLALVERLAAGEATSGPSAP